MAEQLPTAKGVECLVCDHFWPLRHQRNLILLLASLVLTGVFAALPAQASGTVIAWGSNSFGQTNVPVDLTNVVAVAAGGYHSLALLADGTVAAWGDNRKGQADVPVGLSNAVAIAGGHAHSLVLLADGKVTAWGQYWNGSDYEPMTVPTDLSNVVAVAGGGFFNLALCADGTVVPWGNTQFGQTNVPMGLANAVAIAAGGFHCLALRADGAVVAWGANDSNQTNVPTALSNVVAVAGGQLHSVALRADGKVEGWGSSFGGPPGPPASLSNVVSLAAGGFHNLALQGDGTVTAWAGIFGSLYGQTDLPTGLSNVIAMASSGGAAPDAGAHSLALIGPPQPIIYRQPAGRTNDAGTTAWFAVAATGVAPMAYQWSVNGTNLANNTRISGADSARLVISKCQPGDAGDYRVTLTNAHGVAESQLAHLHVVACTNDLTNGLVAYYPLDGDALDASGNGHHGTMHGPVPAADRLGRTSGCCYFDGNSSYISAVADHLPASNRTVSLWFKADRVDTRPGLFGYGGSGSGDSFFLCLNHWGFDAFVLSSHWDAYTLSVPYAEPPVARWYHWVTVMDDDGSRFYLDGAFIGSRTGSHMTAVAGTQLALGSIPDSFGAVPYTDGNVGFFTGCLDEVRIYDRALSETEIHWLYGGYSLVDYYHPINPGNEWIYDSRQNGSTWTTTCRILSAALPLNSYSNCSPPVAYARDAVPVRFEQTGGETWTNYIHVQDPEIGYVGFDHENGARLRFGPGFIVTNRLVLGQTVSLTDEVYSSGVCAGPGTQSIQLVDLADVTVPYGTFTDCLHLIYSNNILGSPQVDEHWWAYGVGPVKWIHTGGGGSETNELRAASYAETLRLVDYYPLPQDASWLYAGFDWDGVPAKSIRRVDATNTSITLYTGRTPVTSYTTNVVSEYNSYVNPTTLVPYDEWVSYLSGGSQFGYFGDAGAGDIRLDGGATLPEFMRVASAVTNVADAYIGGTIVVEVTHRVSVVEKASITVPAGTFTDVVRVRISIATPGGTEVHDEWWAKGVGSVKEAGVSGDGILEQWELIDYSVPATLVILTTEPQFGFASGAMAFRLSGPSGRVVVVEGATNLTSWLPLWTNTLGTTPLYFNDPSSTNLPARFYRVRSP